MSPKAGTDPVTHYLRYGAGEGRHPSPLFDTVLYLAKHPDVAGVGANPLVHFLRAGAKEGRKRAPIRQQRQSGSLTCVRPELRATEPLIVSTLSG